ncbi:PREDICTED: uncharacterized protein LOC106126495 [Papilio xuthus]|uniref:Uncharacterized protein LOC106126495 n=1 Tax=Papilio xuthus TaxID=66420 RepID=A0AAJ6ZUX2_PAPXU|nr:PREDICTED: uncharacterized protein LOC106126495 [Papilio xuthus]
MECKAACQACSKCISLRNDLDLRNLDMKHKHYKNEMLSINKEHGRSYLSVTGYGNVKTCELTNKTNQYPPKCALCKLILPQIRNLVRDISIINIQDIPGICNHCKNINSTLQCERCDYILRSYMQEKECYVDHCNKECHEVIARIKTLLSEFEKHEELMKFKSLSLDKLLKFLKPLKKPVNVQQKETQATDGGIQAGAQGFKSSCVCEDLLKKLQEKLATSDYKNYGKSFIDGKTPSHEISHEPFEKTNNIENKQNYRKSFVGKSKIPSRDISLDQVERTKNIEKKHKYRSSFIDRKVPSQPITHEWLDKTKKHERKQKKEEVTKMKDNKEAGDLNKRDKHEFKNKVKKSEKKLKEGVINKLKDNKEGFGLTHKDKRKPEFKKTLAKNEIEQSKRDKKTRNKKQSDNLKENKYEIDAKKIKVQNKSLDQLEKMINQQKKRKRDQQYNIKKFKIPEIGDLPPLPVKKFKELTSEDSGSIIECEHSDKDFTEMIEGNIIVRYKRGQSRVEPKTKKPLFFNVTHDFGDESLSDMKLRSPVHSKTKSLYKKDELFGKYRLSNRKFIENGWTVLPTLTFVRRVNIYKMIPSSPKLDWLRSHKNEDLIFYETGEVLAEVYDNGSFKWFYRDGNVALDFVDVFDNETNATKEFVVYDEVTKNKRRCEDKIQTLASFDDTGHGVVYDRFGCTRIKYNQDEGVLFDSHIASPCHWKWNALNEPPKIQVEHIFEFLEPLDPYIENLEDEAEISLKDAEKRSLPCSQIKISNEYEDERREIELNNVIREKSMKILMNYKPFEIRSKIFKLNDHFSLRLLGQSKIYILFRDGKICLKLNVGMTLISNEVLDIRAVDNDTINTQEKKLKNNKDTDFKGPNSSLS